MIILFAFWSPKSFSHKIINNISVTFCEILIDAGLCNLKYFFEIFLTTTLFYLDLISTSLTELIKLFMPKQWDPF